MASRPTSLGERLTAAADDLWRLARMGTTDGLAPEHLDLIAGTYEAAALAHRLAGERGREQAAKDSATTTRGAAARQRGRAAAVAA